MISFATNVINWWNGLEYFSFATKHFYLITTMTFQKKLIDDILKGWENA